MMTNFVNVCIISYRVCPSPWSLLATNTEYVPRHDLRGREIPAWGFTTE